jgi:hypothetical protein
MSQSHYQFQYLHGNQKMILLSFLQSCDPSKVSRITNPLRARVQNGLSDHLPTIQRWTITTPTNSFAPPQWLTSTTTKVHLCTLLFDWDGRMVKLLIPQAGGWCCCGLLQTTTHVVVSATGAERRVSATGAERRRNKTPVHR